MVPGLLLNWVIVRPWDVSPGTPGAVPASSHQENLKKWILNSKDTFVLVENESEQEAP